MISAVCLSLIACGTCGAQTCDTRNVQAGSHEDSLVTAGSGGPLLRQFVRWIAPGWLGGSLDVKEFIRSRDFEEYRRERGDLSAVNLIYRKALWTAGGDEDEALAICLLATMDHADFGFRIPLIGLVVTIPLTTETREEFLVRRSHLPSRLYADTPPEGDRDKLQHFFGSAMLAYGSGSRTWTVGFGNLLEVVEGKYVIGGANDPRDRRANGEGARFGKLLMVRRNILPGDVLSEQVNRSSPE